MRTTMLLPVLAALAASTAAQSTTGACMNSYQGKSCNGSLIGTSNNVTTSDISGLICCVGSTDCLYSVSGANTQCTSGTGVFLSNGSAIPTTASTTASTPANTAAASGSASASASAKPNAAVRMGSFTAGSWVASVAVLGLGFLVVV